MITFAQGLKTHTHTNTYTHMHTDTYAVYIQSLKKWTRILCFVTLTPCHHWTAAQSHTRIHLSRPLVTKL